MVLSSEMEQEDKPKWLLELENRKRKPRLAHEVGAGAPCMKCIQSCPGLDLHFWRKICKNCKCSRDDHDVPNDEFPQFDLLFGKSKNQSNKKKMILLNIYEKDNNKGEIFDWAPPDTTAELAVDYMKALPNDKLPIKGTAGAALRKQQLQKQLPLHDIDHKVCDELTESERTQFERYLDNLKKYAGQGKVTKFVTAKPFDKNQMAISNSTDYLTQKPEQSIDYKNINLRTPSSFIPEILPHDINQDKVFDYHRRANILGSSSLPGAELNHNKINYPEIGETSSNQKLPAYSNDNNIKGNIIKTNITPHTQHSTYLERAHEYSQNPLEKIKYNNNNNHGAIDNSIINDNKQPGYLDNSMTPSGIEAQISRLKSPDSHLIQSESLIKGSINPAINFAQTNIHNYDNNNSDSVVTNNYPYNHQYQRIDGVGNYSGELANSESVMGTIGRFDNKPGQQLDNLNDYHHTINNTKNNYDLINSIGVPSYQKHNYQSNNNKSLQAQYCPNKIEKSICNNDNYHNEENSILADKILSDALLQPSSINSSDIIGSTLDQQGLNYIREKLTSKYSDKINSNEINNLQMINNSSGCLNKNSIKPIDTQLLNYGGGINPTIINSQEQNIQIFPDEINGSSSSSKLMENPATDYLGLAMNNLSMIQKKVQICHQCQEDIVVGDVVVTAEKAKDAAWHPGCFICSVCNELLVDLVYFYYKGKLYCGRDLAGLLEIPRCFACDELIFVRKYTVAEGHNYHVKHFCCWDCDLPLAGQQYISEDDKPFCLPCFKKLYAKTCNTCNGVIAPDQVGVGVKHLDFHATDECFCCAECKKPLLNGKIAIKNDKPFCSKECIIKFE